MNIYEESAKKIETLSICFSNFNWSLFGRNLVPNPLRLYSFRSPFVYGENL